MLCTKKIISKKLNLPLTNCPLGSELTIEPFRWDQRFFLISLNMYSVPYLEPSQTTFIPYALSPINSMCEVTGGRSYSISSQRMLYQCLESLVVKIQPGVVMNFEKFGNDPPQLKGLYLLSVDTYSLFQFMSNLTIIRRRYDYAE
jgi:integrator complex subunit 6